jgi:hypothetical protein
MILTVRFCFNKSQVIRFSDQMQVKILHLIFRVLLILNVPVEISRIAFYYSIKFHL